MEIPADGGKSAGASVDVMLSEGKRLGKFEACSLLPSLFENSIAGER